MRIGVVFPRLQIGTDPAAIKDFAQAADALGYAHITIEEHILGADPEREGGWPYGPSGPPCPGGGITKDSPFSEPFVLAGFLAALTQRVELTTGVLILPQRQTALVAKQATELSILSGGRLRLGVGVGWNPVEFQGLGADFQTRGRRQAEQVRLLRQFWSQDVVDFRGRWHHLDRVGLNPRPRAPIPIWFGGNSIATLKRAARLGDGWIPLGLQPGDDARTAIAELHGYLRDAGRDPLSFGIDVAAQARSGDPETWRAHIERWRALGATHITVRIGRAADGGVADLLGVLRSYWEAVSGLP